MPPKGGRASVAGRKKAAPYNPMQELKEMQEIHDVLAEAEQMRSYFQVERDKVNEIWNVTKKEVENAQFRLQNAESELEELERTHQIEMKVYKQKVRHLLYDQKVKVKQLKEENDLALQQAEAAHEKRMAEIQAERQRRLREVQGMMEAHEGQIVDQRDSHHYMITVTKCQNHEKELARLRAAYEAKLSDLRESLELRRRAEVNDVEERRNEDINALARQHEQKFAEMKEYYNSITKNNLEIIRSLKDEIAVMKNNDEHYENLMYGIEKENQNLVAPLEQAERTVAELQQKKKQYLLDKQSLSMTRARLRMVQEETKSLRARHATLEGQYKKVHEEREELRATFESALREAMDTVSERNAALQQTLLEANAKVEERDAQFAGVMAAMNLEPAAMAGVTEQIEHELGVKNQTIKDLHFELRKVERKVEAVLKEYERRCNAAGLAPLPRSSFATTPTD